MKSSPEPLPSRRYRLNRAEMLRLLAELEAEASGGVSSYLPAGGRAPDAERLLHFISDRFEITPEVDAVVAKSRTGVAFYWGERRHLLVVPPFPLLNGAVHYDYAPGPLRALLEKDHGISVVLVRLGEYGVGFFQGEKLVSSKVGAGLVHSRHRQGGSSAHRFERHREKQMEYFFERVCGHARERLEPYLAQTDYLVYGGERHTLLQFRKQCSFISKLDSRVLDRILDVRHPKQAALVAAVQRVWASEVVEWGSGPE